MIIYVLDGGFNKIGFPIDNYISCIWRTSFYDVGDCELYLAADKATLSLLRTGAYLIRDQDMNIDNGVWYENVMDIESIKVESNEESGDHIIVTGKDLKTILKQRVILNDNIMTGTLPQVVLEVFNKNFINPANPNRKISVIDIIFESSDHHEHIVVDKELHDNAGEWILEQCKMYQCGIIPSVNTQKSARPGIIDFFVKKARENKSVVFNNEYINISSSSYQRNTENKKNVAIVAGDEIEGVQIIETVNDDITGISRYETYISSSISADDYLKNDDIVDKETTYRSSLEHEGKNALQETKIEETFECNIESYGQYQLGKDFFLGDKVTVIDKYGIKAQAVITEIIDTHDETGRTIIPQFDDFEVI